MAWRCERALLVALLCCCLQQGWEPHQLLAGVPTIIIDSPLPPPAWALLERELIKQNAAACREFFEKYFDERGWLLCVERRGGDDGPDDAIESLLDWPILHAIGGHDDVLRMYKQAWEGHLVSTPLHER